MNQVLVGRHRGQAVRHELVPGTHRIGRERGNDLCLADPSVSREHAEIVVKAESVTVRDLGSTNGTWVNGLRVKDAQAVRPGDRIHFGHVELLLQDAAGSGSPSESFTTGSAVLSDPQELAASHRLGWLPLRSIPGAAATADRRLLRAVTEAGQLLVSPQTLEEVFQAVLDLVERVVDARRILLLLCGREGELPAIHAARPAGSSTERMMLSRTLLDEVIRGRQSMLVTDAQDDERFRAQESIRLQNVRAALVAPLVDSEKVIGLIYADSSDPKVVYDHDQLEILSFLANLIAVKISTTRLQEDRRQKELMDQEMATAAGIQRSLLPAALPEAPGYGMLAHQTPCHQVGGDLYDAMRLPDGSLILAVGDVCGKGMGAAILMSTVIASLRLLCDEGGPLGELVPRLHRQIFRCTKPMHYVTLFLARLDPTAHRLEYINAGHNSPFLFLPGGPTEELCSTGLPIGLIEDSRFEVAETDLPPGALLCVYSDGIPEAGMGEEQFGEERMCASLRSRVQRPLDEIASGLLDDLAQHLAGEPAGDDVTLFLLRREDVRPLETTSP